MAQASPPGGGVIQAPVSVTHPITGQKQIHILNIPEKLLPPAGTPERGQALSRIIMQKRGEIEARLGAGAETPGLGAGGGSGNSGGAVAPSLRGPKAPKLAPSPRGAGLGAGSGPALGPEDPVDAAVRRMQRSYQIRLQARQRIQAEKNPGTKPEEWQPDPLTGRLRHAGGGVPALPRAGGRALAPPKSGGRPVVPPPPGTEHFSDADWKKIYQAQPTHPDVAGHERAKMGLKSWEGAGLSPVAAGLARIVAQMAGGAQ